MLMHSIAPLIDVVLDASFHYHCHHCYNAKGLPICKEAEPVDEEAAGIKPSHKAISAAAQHDSAAPLWRQQPTGGVAAVCC